jgi:hypothetical protein
VIAAPGPIARRRRPGVPFASMGPLPTRYFLHDPTHTEFITRRGGPVFEMWDQLGQPVVTGAAGAIRRPAFVLTGIYPFSQTAEDIEWLAAQPDIVCVVDIHFPLLRPWAIVGTDDARAWWMDRDRQDLALRIVRAADAVTTPRPWWDGHDTWIDDLAEYNANVHVLPDLDGTEADTGRFARQLLRVWMTTVRTKKARGRHHLTHPFTASPPVDELPVEWRGLMLNSGPCASTSTPPTGMDAATSDSSG